MLGVIGGGLSHQAGQAAGVFFARRMCWSGGPRAGAGAISKLGATGCCRQPSCGRRQLSWRPRTAHDLRRTAATMMAEMGVSSDVINECLNHVIANRVSRIYIRDRRLTEQAKAFELLGKKLSTLIPIAGTV